jgi:GH25 family lysozyme M1 (1,4-beta-N-acetylmuramidase)
MAGIDEKPFLVDLSHWNGTIDWSLAAPHFSAAILKATEGTGFYDHEFGSNKAGCIAQSKPWGNYHFFRPQYNAVTQALYNIQVVGTGCKVYTCDVETALINELRTTKKDARLSQTASLGDNKLRGLEEWDADASELMSELIHEKLKDYHGRTKGLASEKILTLSDMVEQYIDCIRANVQNVNVLVYTSPYFWKTFMKKADGSYPDWNDKCNLWIAHYGVINPSVPVPWKGHLIHQFGTKGIIPGIGSSVDQNTFNETEEYLLNYFGGGTPIPPVIPTYVYINTSSLNVRSVPTDINGTSTIIGSSSYNKRWSPESIAIDERGREWWKMGKSVYIAKWLTRF